MNDKYSIYTENNDNLSPQLESAVWAVLSEPLPPDVIERVKSKALNLENDQPRNVHNSPPVAFTQRRWIQLASLAACILLVIGTTMILPSTSSAFAQAIERLKDTGAFRYKDLVYLNTQEEPVETEVLVAEDGRERRSILGMVSIHDSNGQVRLSLIEASKSATIHEPLIGLTSDSERQFRWLEQLKSYGKNPDKELGTMNIDGRDCLGFEVKPIPNVVYTIWVDSKTNELVQVEFMGMPKGSSVTKSVMKDFEFNISLDPMLFSFDVPQGYQSSTAAILPELLPFEESLVEALKGYTELSGGKFPKSITDWGEWAILLSKDGAPHTTLASRLGALLPYLTGMSNDDYDYTGAGKEIGNDREIVFWYRNPEKQLRAVYSDFTVASISEADLLVK
ncbi:MAG: hypothetical protein ABI557_01665 [Aureliella sp.]